MRKGTDLLTLLTALLSIVCTHAGCRAAEPSDEILFHGASDASAAAFITRDRFVVADDENNSLKIYTLADPSRPAIVVDLAPFLRTTADAPEADIEAATTIADRTYWITSHGRNKDGKERPNRYRFFATETRNLFGITVAPVGRPCSDLVDALLQNPFARDLGLDAATRLGRDLKKKDREKLAPKEAGLNIESLAAAPGGHMFIGLRNPRPAGRAVLIPLTNPLEVIDYGHKPQFAPPVLLDLAGLGLRSMEYSIAHKAFFLVAGPHDESEGCILYKWSGDAARSPVRIRTFEGDFAPEALVPTLDGRLLLLSDDGSRPVTIKDASECIPGELMDNNTCQNKHLADPQRRTFRARWLTLP